MGRRTPLGEDDRRVALAIRRRRLELGLLPRDLAKLIKLSDQQIRNYENLKSPISGGMLRKIARALQCRPADFFLEDEP